MATTQRRTGEKGQRTPRSLDTYKEDNGVIGGAQCGCGAIFRNKRWQMEEGGAVPQQGRHLVCPACRRVADGNPAGIVSLRGSFFAAHETEIENLVRNTARATASKNPLGRVMAFNREKDGATITTTDVKLAQKIGREIFKAHGGELQFKWSHAEDLVRIAWSR